MIPYEIWVEVDGIIDNKGARRKARVVAFEGGMAILHINDGHEPVMVREYLDKLHIPRPFEMRHTIAYDAPPGSQVCLGGPDL